MNGFKRLSPSRRLRTRPTAGQCPGVVASTFTSLAVAGSLILSSGEAMAAGPNFCPGLPPDTATTTTIPGVVTATCLNMNGNPYPDTVPGWNATNQLGSQFTAGGRQDDVVIDFNDGATGTDMPGLPGGFTGYFYYTITSIDDPYITVVLDLNQDGPVGVTGTKKVWYSNPGSDPLLPSYPADLTLAWSGMGVTAPITATTATLWVLDTYTIPTDVASLDNIKNRFTTPGPMPILATGMAFGFSRKLRGRIKASRTA
jgi:hypothetical protein